MRENVISYKYDYPAEKLSGFSVSKEGVFKSLPSILFVIIVLYIFSSVFKELGNWSYILVFFLGFILFIYCCLTLTSDKRLYITPRYLLCGNDIIYFYNVTAIEMLTSQGKLMIQTPNTVLTINRSNFPTNARKDHKIVKNKEEKFRKVSQKIIDRVKAVQPNFEINTPVQQSTQTPIKDLSRY